ncbi:MAG TPA: lipopolysaccharide heptosyltransferase II [Pirellulaceae bacterium]|nr:lipopolysaccharide heptosyltransferase II [Pirellulaceae bacterium]
MNIGIVLPNWVGDVVMATPALRALREHFGSSANLLGIMRPHAAEVLAGTPWLDETFTYNLKQGLRVLPIWRTSRQLKARQLDQIFLLTNSFSTGLLSWLSGARQRIGFAAYGRGALLTTKLRMPRSQGKLVPRSAVEHFLEIAAAVGAAADNQTIELRNTPLEMAAAEAVWQQFKLHNAERVVVLNTGGAYGSAKSWPTEHFAALAKRIVRKHSAAVLVICGPAERAAAAEIVRLADDPNVVSLADKPPSIRLSKGCLGRADLVISTDSGPRHIASALGVPTISLFGPTDPRWSDNFHPLSTMLQEPVPCGPCGKRACPLKHHRCMVDLSVDRVFASVEQQFQRSTQQAA